MSNRTRRVLLRAGTTLVAVVVLAATPTVVQAAKPDRHDLLLGRKPAAAATPKPADKDLARRAHAQAAKSSRQMLTMKVTDPARAKAAGRTNAVATEGYGCSPYLATQSGLGQPDEFLEETASVDYYGELNCNFYLNSLEAIAGVIDRSESWQGQNFDGTILGTGTYWYSEGDYFAASQGGIGLGARYYDGGRTVEAAIEAYLWAPEGIVWDACNSVFPYRYLACDGLGTDYLHVVIGSDGFGSGLTRVCRDRGVALDTEQARINAGGGTPASTQILGQGGFEPLRAAVIEFKRDLCLQNSGGEVGSLADSRGQNLWNDATTIAKGARPHDDRGLYWARLHMTAAIHQYRRTGIDVAGTEQRLDRPSRGMSSHTFDRGAAKTAFVSGFDPFQLDGALFRGNPSAASVLGLDNEIVNGAEVEVVILPVRYQDFNDGIVEQAFETHLNPGSGQRADIVTTVSQGGSTNFELEIYNGRRRAAPSGYPPLTDNRNLGPTVGIAFPDGSGTYDSPVTPPVAGGAEFTQSSLPVSPMTVGPTIVDFGCDEQPPGTGSQPCPGTGPTAGSIAVQGSGAGYLSNEVAYRVTRLRDALGSSSHAGHVHTPYFGPPGGPGAPGFGTVASQYRAILAAGIDAS